MLRPPSAEGPTDSRRPAHSDGSDPAEGPGEGPTEEDPGSARPSETVVLPAAGCLRTTCLSTVPGDPEGRWDTLAAWDTQGQEDPLRDPLAVGLQGQISKEKK